MTAHQAVTWTVVATANVLDRLPRADARASLEAVLAHDPDLIGLQEWGIGRHRLLPSGDYLWVRPAYGGNPIGARADRYCLLGRRVLPLAGLGRADRGARPLPVLPPRVVTVATLHDRLTGREVAVVCYHLVPGTQSRRHYRADRPLLSARHRTEVARLTRIVEGQLAAGRVVHALGDSNFDGLRLPGLTSAWAGREDDPIGTLGSARKIDDVLGPGPAEAVELVRTASDHAAVVVRRQDRP